VASLLFEAGPNAGRRYKLGDGDYIIGRRSDCQIFVPDMRVSRQHAKIQRKGEGWQIEDLGSNNGTFVNGKPVQVGAISHQDEISIANNRIRVEIPELAKGGFAYDANVTIVDLRNPKVFVSTDESSDSGFLNASLAGVQEGQRDMRLLERKVNALTSLLESAATTTDPLVLLDKIVEALLEVFPSADSVGVLVEDEKTGELQVQTKRHRKKLVNEDMRVPGTIIRHVVEDRKGILLQGDDALLGSGRRPRAQTPQPTIGLEPSGSRMGAPLQAHDENFGAIYVESKDGKFKQEDVNLLTSIAAQAGLAMHATKQQQRQAVQERMERDLRVARQIQRSLLPSTNPEVLGLEFGIHYEPAYQIGGDFYDFIWHDKSHLGMVIGDVSGKAISAAMYMASLTSQLRSRAAIARTPAKLLSKVNESMLQLGDDGMFATLAYMIYDLETRSLVFTNAGHMVPLLRRDGRVYPIQAEQAHCTPVGIMEGMEFGEARVQLHSGDLLILSTDGVHEARDPNGNEYGLKRLSRRIRSARGTANEVVKAILQDIDTFVGNGPQADDITVLAVGIGRRRARRRTDTVPGLPVEAELATTSSINDSENHDVMDSAITDPVDEG
jgi:serine phosphatase RsbU (regulator of sigma subunit)